MDVPILLGFVGALLGVISALAKVAWNERGVRVQNYEKDLAYYRDQVMPLMHRVLDASEQDQKSIAVLTRVLEDGVKGFRDSG